MPWNEICHPPTACRLANLAIPACHRLSATGYRLSAIGYRLSAIGHPLSAIGYRLSAINS